MSDIFNLEAAREVLVTSLSELGRTVATFVPTLVGVLVILALGWVVSRVVQSVSRRLLSRVGLDRVSTHLGVGRTLSNAGITSAPSEILARLLFWLLMLTFVLSAADTLGLDAVTGTIDRLIAYLPNVIAAALILILGLLIARFIGNVVSSGASAADVPYAREVGRSAQGVVTVLIAVLAIEQLGVDTQILISILTVAVGAFAAGLALAFAVGSRDVVRAVLAGHYLRQTLAEGDRVEVDGRGGVVERIGATETLFRDGDKAWTTPNGMLLQSVVIRLQPSVD